jgi:aryl-alcohol dehydrogenase-like predicted oxidoreductase
MGAMNLSFGTGSAVDERTGISVLHAALDRGINFFDTAQAYGPYTNEKLVGNALSTCREKGCYCNEIRL